MFHYSCHSYNSLPTVLSIPIISLTRTTFSSVNSYSAVSTVVCYCVIPFPPHPPPPNPFYHQYTGAMDHTRARRHLVQACALPPFFLHSSQATIFSCLCILKTPKIQPGRSCLNPPWCCLLLGKLQLITTSFSCIPDS
jgi:hypothetical protein